MTWLLDVNVLLSLADPYKETYEAAHRWARQHGGQVWASCPLTENGFIRILCQRGYPGGPFTPTFAIEILERLKKMTFWHHRVFPDSFSLADPAVVHSDRIAGPSQLTDIYLVALAMRNNASLVTFDTKVPWQAVVGATADIVFVPQV